MKANFGGAKFISDDGLWKDETLKISAGHANKCIKWFMEATATMAAAMTEDMDTTSRLKSVEEEIKQQKALLTKLFEVQQSTTKDVKKNSDALTVMKAANLKPQAVAAAIDCDNTRRTRSPKRKKMEDEVKGNHDMMPKDTLTAPKEQAAVRGDEAPPAAAVTMADIVKANKELPWKLVQQKRKPR